MSELNFDATTVEPRKGFELIPAGKYTAIITGSVKKATNAGTGKYLNLTFQIVDGQYKDRNLWAILNLWNPNDQAVKIANGDLSAICHAVGVMKLKESSELHNLPLIIKVGLQKRKDLPGEFSNVIKGYEEAGSTPPEAAVAGSTPPWKKS